jgi:hypothetical protein
MVCILLSIVAASHIGVFAIIPGWVAVSPIVPKTARAHASSYSLTTAVPKLRRRFVRGIVSITYFNLQCKGKAGPSMARVTL